MQLLDHLEFVDDIKVEEGHDYWYRRGALLSLNGLLLPIVVLANVIWSKAELFSSYEEASECSR